MCKCCKSMFDSCYWHCYGKWQFDEDIALYQDENTQEKDPRAIDNLAFWDSVSIIASRSAIMTQPIDKPPIRRQISIPKNPNTPTKPKPKDKRSRSIFIIDSPDVVDSPNIPNITIMDTSNSTELSTDISTTDEEKLKPEENKIEFEKKKSRKKSIIEEKIEKKYLAPEPERTRKKSLKERRNSTADLTIEIPKFDTFHEIPNVKISNIPKHYEKWTPEDNPFMRPDIGSSILVSPVLANTPQFDLESIVMEVNNCKAMENEKYNQKISTKNSIRMENIRRKIKPILIKKQPSTKSLPDLAKQS